MEAWCGMCVPGANGHGPMREAGRVLRDAPLSPVSGTACGSCRRSRWKPSRPIIGSGLIDGLFKTAAPWGLGFALDATAVRGQRHHSPHAAFGHGGSLSSEAYCDPEYGLVVAVVCNGRPASDKHRERFAALSSAVYEDLGLARPDEPDRTGEKREN